MRQVPQLKQAIVLGKCEAQQEMIPGDEGARAEKGTQDEKGYKRDGRNTNTLGQRHACVMQGASYRNPCKSNNEPMNLIIMSHPSDERPLYIMYS